MAASARLSLVSRYSIGPATENASSRPAMHRMCSFGISHFFRTFLRCQNACFCAFIACVSVFNRTCHRKCKLQACNAPNVQFWHKPFFRPFLILLFQASGTQTRQLTVFFTRKQGGSARIMNCVAGTSALSIFRGIYEDISTSPQNVDFDSSYPQSSVSSIFCRTPAG